MIETLLEGLMGGTGAPPWLAAGAVGLFALAGGVAPIVVGRFFRIRRPSFAKCAPYECGIEPVGDARAPFPVRYYVVAALFLILDVEAALLYPWAAAFGPGSAFLLVEFLVFAALLAAGYAWAWRKGALDGA